MVKKISNKWGYTLTELMIVVAILGVLASVGPSFYQQVRRFFFLSTVRTELQRDARTVMGLITKRMRHAQSDTIVIDQESGQPPYSRISFTDVSGGYFRYYHSGRILFMVDSSTHAISRDARYVSFALPRSDDLGIVSVSLTFEKSIYEGRTKALHMASERVRVMN